MEMMIQLRKEREIENMGLFNHEERREKNKREEMTTHAKKIIKRKETERFNPVSLFYALISDGINFPCHVSKYAFIINQVFHEPINRFQKILGSDNEQCQNHFLP